MDTDNESQYNGEPGSPMSNASHSILALGHCRRLRFNCGMDVPMPAAALVSPTTQQPFNLGVKLPTPVTQATLLLQPFNLGLNLPVPVTQPFNLGLNLPIPVTKATLLPPPFNLKGVKPTVPVTQPTLLQQPFNLGFKLPITSTPLQATLPAAQVQQPFNLGFNLPVQTSQPQQATNSHPAFNLGFNLPIPATQATPVESPAMPLSAQPEPAPPVQGTLQHVGYDIHNKPAFQFGCQQPSPIGQWTPALIRAPSLMPVEPLDMATAMPAAPVTAPVKYGTIELPNIEGMLQPPILASLVGDAEQAAMDVVRHLGGEEFDELVQMMISGAMGDNVRDPKPDKILASNRVMLSVFCENRDRLTRIFKDLISLHHIAQLHEQVDPAVNALLQEVEHAEAKTADSK
ncbi:hypothetical protein EDB19DRAFT_1834602 [Suillus lakei]|nr:hypothetical protein EDB19DRAFT_1834602 [Suillus lakei]